MRMGGAVGAAHVHAQRHRHDDARIVRVVAITDAADRAVGRDRTRVQAGAGYRRTATTAHHARAACIAARSLMGVGDTLAD